MVQVSIEDINHLGQGVGTITNEPEQGMKVFVTGLLPGDVAEVAIMQRKKNFAIANCVQLLIPSTFRITEAQLQQQLELSTTDRQISTAINLCGGCNLKYLAYEQQLKVKANTIVRDLQKIAKFDMEQLAPCLQPVIAMQNPFFYRNNLQLNIVRQNNAVAIGFYQLSSHTITPSHFCPIQPKLITDIITALQQIISTYQLSIYNRENKQGLMRQCIVRLGLHTNEVLVIFVLNARVLPYAKQIEADLRKIIENNPTDTEQAYKLVGLLTFENKTPSNDFIAKNIKLLAGRDYLHEKILGLTYQISANAFFQVNTQQTEVLYQKILDFAQLTQQQTVFDLYCGTGSISLLLAQQAKKVVGIEVNKVAIQDAKRNAKLNQLQAKTEFYVGRAEVVTAKLYAQGYLADLVVVDPPRKGCDIKLLQTILQMHPSKIIYVSCNSTTLARDLAILVQSQQYKISQIQPVDMFPHTPHVETVVLMDKSIQKP